MTNLDFWGILKNSPKEKTIYISGAIKGLDREVARKRFKETADLWQDQGWIVVNPFDIPKEIDAPQNDDDYYYHLTIDVRALTYCGAIALIPGWTKSNGATLEFDIARRLKLKLFNAETFKQFG